MSKFYSALVRSGLNNRLKRTPVLLRFASIQQHWSDAKSRGVLLVAFCFLTVCASGHAIADDHLYLNRDSADFGQTLLCVSRA